MRVGIRGLSLVALIVAAPMVWAAGGGSTSGSGSVSAPRKMSPAEQAKSAYNDGVRAVKQAEKYEAAAAEITDEGKKAKALERARRQYEKTRSHFLLAIQHTPDMHEAWNYIGYTSRKLGEYGNALGAYDEALRLKPTYAEAIEYRGEAYLGLDRIDDAKGAYMALFKDARPLADQLMAAMQRWVAERRVHPGSVPSSDVDAFAKWVDERNSIAQQTVSMAVDAVPPSWH